MTLLGLQSVLQSQVDGHEAFVVSSATIQAAKLTPTSGFDRIVRSHLLLQDDLALAFRGRVPSPSGTTLALSGTAATLLGAKSFIVDIVFIKQEDGRIDVRVSADLPDTWTLGQAFSALQGEPFSELNLSSTRYVVTTATEDTFQWQGGSHAIKQGAWLFGMLTLDGPLAVIVALLKGAHQEDQTALMGSIDPSHMAAAGELPLLDLTAGLNHTVGVPQFDLVAPRIELRTTSDSEGRLWCWLNFATTLCVDDQPLCDFKASVSSGTDAVSFGMFPLADSKVKITLPLIFKLLGAEFTIPPALVSVFDSIGLKGLSATVSTETLSILSASAAIGSTEPGWSYGQVTIEETTLRVTALRPASSGPVMLTFDARSQLFPNTSLPAEFDVVITYDVESKDITVAAGLVGTVSVADALSAVSDGKATAPEGWRLSFTQLGVTFEKPADGKAHYTLFASADAAFGLPLLGSHVDSDVQLLVDSAASSFKLTGGMSLGDSRFQVDVDLSAESKILTGSWTALNNDYLELSPLLRDLGFSQVVIPKGLDLKLASATVSYDISAGLLMIEADSRTYGRAVFAAMKAAVKDPNAPWVFFFGLNIDRRMGLSDLPLIGKELGAIDVAVDEIAVLVSSKLAQDDASAINAAIARLHSDATYPTVPPGGMKDVALRMTFDAGGQKTPLLIAAPPDDKLAYLAVDGEGPPAAPAASDGTIWINLQKTFGPVTFQKVGVRYRSSVLYFLMNASVSGGGLTVAVMGLGAGSPLTTFEPVFTIDGLAITFAEGPVEMSGALVGSLDPVSFYGEVVLGIEELQIAAIGGYSEVDGHPSLFLYAVLDYPIGGPTFFFVTGLAAGFGYNRRLLIPPVDGVASFPLVEWAEGTGPPSMDATSMADEVTKVVTQLTASGVVAPSVGDDWVAFGVKFTSFDLVSSFALLTIVFGTRFEIALLGTSTVQLPPGPEPPVAQAQLELEATFTPATGLLAISGQLTPQSFVLSRNCHLTGGFAMRAWFSGEHEGEFVVSLGGYSPRFTPPSYYPAVPRLGLAWKVSPELSVNGDLYFALTSSAVMAGGGLDAVWQSGGIRAWFSVQIDFLLVFEPFHYYMSAAIQLGASFTVDLWFTSITVSIHLGVGIEIWGPEFQGRATVDLSIISFTISFGSGGRRPDTQIGWSDFVQKLMPKAQDRGSSLGLAAGETVSAPAAIVQIVPSGGLVKRLSDEEGPLNWVMNGTACKLVTQSAIPTKEWEFLTSNIRLADGSPSPATGFGVGPTGTSVETFRSTHTIEITAGEPGSKFEATPLVRNVSTALWQPRQFDSNGIPVGVDPLNETTVPGACVGFTLSPVIAAPDHTLPIPRENIEYTIVGPVALAWSDASVPPSGDLPDEPVWQTIGGTAATSVRSTLATVIAHEGFPIPTQIDVEELATKSSYDLMAPPALRLLGEQK